MLSNLNKIQLIKILIYLSTFTLYLFVAIKSNYFSKLTFDDNYFLTHAQQPNWQWLIAPFNGHVYFLTKILITFEYSIFGFPHWGYFVVLQVIHLINLILLNKLLQFLIKTPLARLAALTLFAISSLYYHLLVWINAQGTLLSLTFMALSILWFLQYHQNSQLKYLFFSLVSLLISGLWFGSGLTFPLTLLILALYFKEIIAVKTYGVFTVIYALMYRLLLEISRTPVSLVFGESLHPLRYFHTVIQGIAYGFTARFFFPVCIFCSQTNPLFLKFIAGGSLLLFVLLVLYSQRKAWLNGFLIYYLTAALIRGNITHDRHTYIPLFFFSIFSALFMDQLIKLRPKLAQTAIPLFVGYYFLIHTYQLFTVNF